MVSDGKDTEDLLGALDQLDARIVSKDPTWKPGLHRRIAEHALKSR